jgi:hypothetical protein
MHRITQHEAFLDAAFPQTIFNLRRDVNVLASACRIEPKLFSITFHSLFVSSNFFSPADCNTSGPILKQLLADSSITAYINGAVGRSLSRR